MKKGLIGGVKSAVKNLFLHVAWVLSRREGLRAATHGVGRDFLKLMHIVRSSKKSPDAERAARWVKKGRLAYNERRYEAAEMAFREAILTDPAQAIAYTYLGHTLYKLGRPREAVVYWSKAVDVDPVSEAAQKARHKIAMMHEKRGEMTAWIEDRIGE